MAIEKQLVVSEAEYERRLNRVRSEIAARGLDVVLLVSPSNTFYLTGYYSVNLWDFQCLIVPLSGNPVLVIREFETARFQASCRLQEPWTYPPEGSGPATVVEVLRSMRGDHRRIGVEESRYLDARSSTLIRSSLPDAEFSDAADILDDMRAIKSPEELAHLRRAAEITDIGMEAAISAVREGTTDYAIAAEANRALLAGGSDFMCIDPIVAAGQNSGLAHSTASGLRVGSGNPVFIELGGCVRRYTAPLMRTAAVTPVASEIQELADYSCRVLDVLIEVIKPGIRACDVAAAGRRALAPIESRIFFHYVWAYSVGVGFPPSWLEESRYMIQAEKTWELLPGMVFHLPTTLRIFGRYGAGFSETVLVTATGAEVLTKTPRTLRIV